MVATNASTTNRRMVVGVFDGPHRAEQALNDLKHAGFTPEQVSVVAQDRRETQGMVESTGMGEGAGKGALAGGLLGGLGGFLLGISALTIPGIGPIVGSGILLSTLAGAGIGAAAGGLVGALAEHGVPEAEARGYEESVRRGSILLTVHAHSDAQAREAQGIFAGRGGGDVRAYGTGNAAASMAQLRAAHGTAAPGGGRDVITSGELRDEGLGTRGR